jgi:type III restriction enzyme
MELFVPNKLCEKVKNWRDTNYSCNFPAIAEIFSFAFNESENGEKSLNYLRKAQFEALETYWYLRIVERSPHIFELYKRLYDDPVNLLKALGITLSDEDYIRLLSSGGLDSIFEKIKSDNAFVKKNRLEIVRESLTLGYPSYILALAMGSGKTVLIGAIIATEFSMSLEYPNEFVKNALVFAPGKTILGALKEISDIPFEKILPPRFFKQFMSCVRITYTQDKEKDIPINRGSSFNIIVTNTEKIRIQKPTAKLSQSNLLNYKQQVQFEEEQEIANLRLQTIASLPHLAIFSDEAHHTYGQSLNDELKKVRQTVDYLSRNTNVIVVVNTTGTPYYKKQMLRDVVYWYGLSQGIKDGILKEVKDSIYSYDNITSEDFLNAVIEDFFKKYRHVMTYDGAYAKLAVYFPQTEDLRKLKPVVEKKVCELGLDPSIVLEVHNESEEKVKDLFNNRINDTHNPYRVYLLVNMGTEGWNCPSLFATALARKLKSSNNFVLQTSSRCLRQIPGNIEKARIYLSKDNVSILDAQLRETFGETLQLLDTTKQEIIKDKVVVRKVDIPPISIKMKVKKVIADERNMEEIRIERTTAQTQAAKKIVYDMRERIGNRHILAESSIEPLALSENFEDIYDVAIELSSVYRLDVTKIYDLLAKAYPQGEIESTHLINLKEQIEKQIRNYRVTEEEVEVALALVKLDGFEKENLEGKTVYTTEIMYRKEHANLLLRFEQFKDSNTREFSFHFSPYNMDSAPEKDLFLQLLEALNENPDDVEDVYFTGSITDLKKTDFLFEYKDKNGKWRMYTPDFVIRKKDGRTLIVEVKGEVFKDETKDMAMKKMENLNPDKLKYVLLVAKDSEIGFENKQKVMRWIYGGAT